MSCVGNQAVHSIAKSTPKVTMEYQP